ncbi:TPA: hypothetical protein ACTV4G_000448 [Citrobacter freundii]|uniref:hypothetical protein n=1 Tax=Citrobacter TaxID=544 RepID=UPI0006523B5F|nr:MULTISPECIES: hypothetical protein [Citrobacter]KLV46085.1 hypothetical protein SK31_01850 [Citrobacter sp. MGH99]MDE8798513.1 hypothetical protein [Citrobacter freundii]MDE8803611.1 hypothetical protein [Citrobacter freundii]DAO21204.1 MAG TPA: hypothetical protein [Caudoviricetes sp.]
MDEITKERLIDLYSFEMNISPEEVQKLARMALRLSDELQKRCKVDNAEPVYQIRMRPPGDSLWFSWIDCAEGAYNAALRYTTEPDIDGCIYQARKLYAAQPPVGNS